MSVERRRHIVLRLLSWRCCCCSARRTSRTSPSPGQPPGQIELAQGWSLVSARDVPADGAALSKPDYKATGWHAIPRMPATVLQTLQEDGTYPNLYYGTNLVDEVPQDLYKQDWWYRTTFTAPAGPHDIHVGLSRHQLPRRDLAERPPDRGQHPDRRHAHRPRTRRLAMGEPGSGPTRWPSRSHRSARCRTSTASNWLTAGMTGSTGTTSATKGRERIRPTGIRLSPTAMRASGSRFT